MRLRSRHILHAPVQYGMEHRKQIQSLFRQTVLDMGRNFVELFPFDNAQPLQLTLCIRQHRIRQTGKKLSKFAETHRAFHAEQIDDLHLPLPLQEL